ncbi:MAG: hydroxyacid dehydrogenase [Chloroflexi bacterium]|nr:hydroxyacid dehydrogenase [Chloroflexota bacterium]
MPGTRLCILITEPIHAVGVALLARESEAIYLPDRPGETVDQHLPDVHGVVVRTARIDAVRLARAPKLRVVGKHGVGVDNIDVAAARAQSVEVIFTPGTNDNAVADHTVMLLLMLAHQIERAQALLRAGRFDDARRTMRGADLRGKTLALVGVGRIGSRVAAICRQSFGMRVLAFDPYVDERRARELGVELWPDLVGMLGEADFVSLHTPLTPETRGIVGERELAALHPTAILVNCARGGLVDEGALAEALRAGRLAGAGLDVFAQEPPPPDHPLLHLDNVIVSPHIAGQTEDAARAMATLVAEEVLRVLRGEPARHPVA